MPAPVILEKNGHSFKNWHTTKNVGGRVEHYLTPTNRWIDGSPVEKGFQPGLLALRQAVREAEAKRERIRCVGAAWSLNNLAFTGQRLVNTCRLTHYFVGFQSDSMVTPAYQKKKNRLIFAQAGTQVVALNDALEKARPERLALPTCGASNGQTIVGATQTGTHGSAHAYGPMPNYVRALHIVAEGGEHYLIQKRGAPVVTKNFADYLGAELREDDELFSAAVVGLGSFGLIHAVLLEAVPMFGLGRWVKQVDFPSVQNAIYNFDPKGLGLPSGDKLPWHFEVVVNPYLRGPGQRGAFIRVYDKFVIKAGDPLPRIPVGPGGLENSRDLVTIGGLFTDAVPDLIPGALQGQIENSLRSTGGAVIRGTPGGQFNDSQPTNGGTSMELGVAAEDVRATAEAIFQVTDQHVFGAPVAFRWVKGSHQTLSFSRFTPLTCHIEMPGIDSSRTRNGYQMIWQALDRAGIRYTCHWGQALPASPAWVKRAFGTRVERWLAARRAFLSPEGRRTFSNDLLDSYGLGD
ncbi:MAG: hypothetical protein B6A08_17090 [Sorangiineae bacterium NIC37A_2]|nr:MAG: hypothetical protein B6A08_17090 [Sorangiineae bacterium NIC37A_2]